MSWWRGEGFSWRWDGVRDSGFSLEHISGERDLELQCAGDGEVEGVLRRASERKRRRERVEKARRGKRRRKREMVEDWNGDEVFVHRDYVIDN